MTTQTAVITGATRGIGLETARQMGQLGYKLFVTGTTKNGIARTVEKLKVESFDVVGKDLDQGKKGSVNNFAKWLAKQTEKIDVLINCAGIYPEKNIDGSVLTGDEQAVLDSFNVNTFGPWRLTRALAPMINENGRIVNVSSIMASLTHMNSGSFGYRASKTALNTLTRLTAMELANRGIMVNALHPGWVKTDMGGPNADIDVEESARGLVWAATLAPGGPSGQFFWDGKTLEW